MPNPILSRFLKGRSSNLYCAKVLSTSPASLIAYWPMSDLGGSACVEAKSKLNGAYAGVTLARSGIGDGLTCPSWPGTSSYLNLYSAGLNAVFNGAEGSAFIWCKVSAAGVWSDGTYRRILQITSDSANTYILISRNGGTTGRLYMEYKSVSSQLAMIDTSSPLGWFTLGLSWSKSNDRVRPYVNGVQYGSDMTVMGTWSGALVATTCTSGAKDTTGANGWSGNLAHLALWNTELPAATFAALSVL
jgi:hypothetical protein